MRSALILLLMLGAGAAHAGDEASRWGFSAGLGASLAWGREINPDFKELRSSPLVFAGARFSHYGLNVEYALDPERRTSSGGLNIRTESTTVGAWGRYAFGAPPEWQPFVTLGGGVHLDQVRTSFQGRYDERGGTRRFLGAGGGVSKEFWDLVLGELELRVTSEEASRQYGLSLALRLGVAF